MPTLGRFATFLAIASVQTADAAHSGQHQHKRAAVQYTTITTTVTTSSTTNVPYSINQDVSSGVSTFIPGALTMTFAGPGYLYLETVTPSITVVTTKYKTKVPVTAKTSNFVAPTSTSAKTSSTAKAIASSSSSAAASSSTSGTMCAWTLDGNINPKFTISNDVYTDGNAPNCASECQSNAACKSFTFHTQSGRYSCALFNASIAGLLQAGPQTKDPVDGSTSSSNAIYYDTACAASSGDNCGFFTNSFTATGQKAFISRDTPRGNNYTPCYHTCQTTKGCKSFFFEGTSTDASGNTVSTCSYYSASVADTFVAGGWGKYAFDAGCVPGL